MPKVHWNAVALSGLLALAIVATPAAAQKPGGTLVQITQPEPPNLAPYISTSAPISQVTAKVYDGLLEYGFDLKPKAGLAESWEVAPDGRTVTFKLRKDVKFHDGKPFTSADVQFTIMEVLKKAHPRGISTIRDVTAVETPDEHTAIFKLSNAAPYMLAALSGYESPMLPKHVFGQGDIKSHANANSPIGTGPFKFVEWRRGELVRLDKNPDYWRKGLPYLDRIVVRFINDEATRTAALEKGEAHVAGFGAVPYSDAKKLAQLPSIEVTTKGYEMIVMYGVWAPAKTPADVVNRLNADIVKVVKAPAFTAWLQAQGVDPRTSTPAQMQAYLQSEIPKLERLVKVSGAKVD